MEALADGSEERAVPEHAGPRTPRTPGGDLWFLTAEGDCEKISFSLYINGFSFVSRQKEYTSAPRAAGGILAGPRPALGCSVSFSRPCLRVLGGERILKSLHESGV